MLQFCYNTKKDAEQSPLPHLLYRLQWYFQPECGTLSELRLHAYVSAKAQRIASAYGETEACALYEVIDLEEAVENLFLIL